MGYKTIDPKENMELQRAGHTVVGIRRVTESLLEYEFDFDKQPDIVQEPVREPEPKPEEVPAKKSRGVQFKKRGG